MRPRIHRRGGCAYPHQLLWEGPTRVLRHVDGWDDPVPLLSAQPAGVRALGPRAQRVAQGLSRAQGWRLPAFLRRLSEAGEKRRSWSSSARRKRCQIRESVRDRQSKIGRRWGEGLGVREDIRWDPTYTKKEVTELSGGRKHRQEESVVNSFTNRVYPGF